MKPICRCASFAVVCLLSATASAIETPKLVRVYLADKNAKPIVGELIAEYGGQVTVYDFAAGENRELASQDVREIKRGITEESAYASVGLPNLLAWQVKRSMPLSNASGKIAKLDQSTIYVNLGSSSGIEKGQELLVYRGSTEIRDPDTNEVLDRQRRLIGKLLVSEVREAVCKCKHVAEIETEYRVGDEVESQAKVLVAVLPLPDESGNEVALGNALAEEITTGLATAGIPLVERSRLVDALTELAIQQTMLFSPESAQKVGLHIGAKAVLVGTVSESGKSIRANVRLVKVSTGEILFARSHSIRGSLPVAAATGIGGARPGKGSLLSNLDLSQVNKRHNWTFENGLLKYTGNGLRDGLITFPRQLPKEFQLAVEASPANAEPPVCLAFYFTAGGAEFIVQLSNTGSCIIYDGKDPRSDGTAKNEVVFAANKPSTIVYQVRKGSLIVKVNGRNFLELKDSRLGTTTADTFAFGILGEWTISKVDAL